MVVNEASHIFIFCMDRIIYVLNIYDVDIETDKKKPTYACFIWLTWSCIWNKGVFQWMFWLTAGVSLQRITHMCPQVFATVTSSLVVPFSICLMHKWMTMGCRGWLESHPLLVCYYTYLDNNECSHIHTHAQSPVVSHTALRCVCVFI